MTGVRRVTTAAITLLTAALMLDGGWTAAARVASGTHVTVERGKPNVKQPSPKPKARQTPEVTDATNKYGIGIGSRTRRTETRTYERRGPEDVDRPVDRARRVGREVVARRALTVEERALGQARRRAECLATLARVSRIYREDGARAAVVGGPVSHSG